MSGPMSYRLRKTLASFLGTLLLIMLLLLASFNRRTGVEPPPKITLHEVRMYAPPPKPPPPPVKQQGTRGAPTPSLTRANAEDSVKLDIMDLEVDMDAVAVRGFGAGGPGGMGGIGMGGGGEWGAVIFSELDNIPMVKSASTIPYPDEASEQGVTEFRVLIHIVIDEEGRAYPVRILQNPFPSINEEILKFTSTAVFTPPTRMGAPVKTEFAWPLLFKKP